MTDLLPELQRWLLALALATPRMLAAFSVLPFLGPQVLPGLIRNGIVIVLTLVLLPGVAAQTQTLELDYLLLAAIVLKEILLGLLIGYLASIVFWAVGSMGFFIDFQRGAMSATLFSTTFGDQTSPLGAFLNQAVVTLLFVGGGFLLLLDTIYLSYQTWPVTSFWPDLNWAATEFFLRQFDLLMYLVLLFAGPALIIMFLSELGLGLIGRFLPQLNIFLVAMPVKSALAMLLLMLYCTSLLHYIQNGFQGFAGLIRSLESLLQ